MLSRAPIISPQLGQRERSETQFSPRGMPVGERRREAAEHGAEHEQADRDDCLRHQTPFRRRSREALPPLVDRLALHAPGRLDRIEEVRRRDVAEAVVVGVALGVAGDRLAGLTG